MIIVRIKYVLLSNELAYFSIYLILVFILRLFNDQIFGRLHNGLGKISVVGIFPTTSTDYEEKTNDID